MESSSSSPLLSSWVGNELFTAFLFRFIYSFIVPPEIEKETFEPMNRILEGKTTVVNCLASGSLPVITNWYRGGELILEKQRGNMLEITDATIYDTGRYVCTVKNPAGEATAETYVQIRKYILQFLFPKRPSSVGRKEIGARN